MDENTNSTMALNSKKADNLLESDFFIWDEAPMASLNSLNAIDRPLKKLLINKTSFGEKQMVLVIVNECHLYENINKTSFHSNILDLVLKDQKERIFTCKIEAPLGSIWKNMQHSGIIFEYSF